MYLALIHFLYLYNIHSPSVSFLNIMIQMAFHLTSLLQRFEFLQNPWKPSRLGFAPCSCKHVGKHQKATSMQVAQWETRKTFGCKEVLRNFL